FYSGVYHYHRVHLPTPSCPQLQSPLLRSSPTTQSQPPTSLPTGDRRRGDGVGDAVPGGGVLLCRGRPLCPRCHPRLPLSFATSWGAALWATFIGGIIMFKNLPRHMFGNLQSKMFPAYFTLISACAAISVAAFAYLHPWKTASTVERYQLGFLLSSLGCNLSNLLVFTPMTIEMMKKRHKIERDLSIGEEVGWTKNQQVAKSNPTLAAMNKKFGMIHGLSSLANIMSFGSLAMHSWYLASKIEL
ncbi:unnamed protein product, partial [Urochloa humidicola]